MITAGRKIVLAEGPKGLLTGTLVVNISRSGLRAEADTQVSGRRRSDTSFREAESLLDTSKTYLLSILEFT